MCRGMGGAVVKLKISSRDCHPLFLSPHLVMRKAVPNRLTRKKYATATSKLPGPETRNHRVFSSLIFPVCGKLFAPRLGGRRLRKIEAKYVDLKQLTSKLASKHCMLEHCEICSLVPRLLASFDALLIGGGSVL